MNFSGRAIFFIVFIALFVIFGLLDAYFWRGAEIVLFVIFFFFCVGIHDVFQTRRNVLRNYPVIGHVRYLLLKIRPEIQQYYIETDQSGTPFDEETRHVVRARARLNTKIGSVNKQRYTVPFGTQLDVYQPGFEWINHSMCPTKLNFDEARLTVGGPHCTKPYSASRLNISAMSFGAISQNAVEALNLGAKINNFAHNTGEGGLSPYHLKHGGDIILQVGTAYFGFRNPDGSFNADVFKIKAQLPAVKMIEIKISQGAKPAHGGLLPGAKISQEIADIRMMERGKDCESPAKHATFSTPIGLMHYIAQLRELSGGKPVGFKLCIGSPTEFMSVVKAMLETGIYPDFITVDGKEGGTGAAPMEFVDHLGTPLFDALAFVHNILIGAGLREHIRLIASGKVTNGFSMARLVALGADLCNSARGMMFALGCIQARRCNTNKCPTGITTQDPKRMKAIDVKTKSAYVASYHDATVLNFLEVLGAAGVEKVDQLTPEHLCRRTGLTEVKTYADLYPRCEPNALINGTACEKYQTMWANARAEKFVSAKDFAI